MAHIVGLDRRVVPSLGQTVWMAGNRLTGYQREVYLTAPLAYWPLDEASGTTIRDKSGHGYHGTYNGPTLANAAGPGGLGLAPSFDGLNDRGVLTSASLQAALSRQELTLMAWAKVSAAAVWTDAAYREVFHVRVSATNRAYFLKNNVNNNLQFLYNGNNATTKTHSWTSQSSVDWMHLVQTVSVSNNRMRSYINGVAFGTPSTAINAWVGDPAVGIGWDGSASWWKGWLAHVAIWNRELSAEEIGALYST